MARVRLGAMLAALVLVTAPAGRGEDLASESFVVRSPGLAGGAVLDARSAAGSRSLDATLGLPGVAGTAVGPATGRRLEAGFWPTAVRLRTGVVEDVVALAAAEIFAAAGHRDALLDLLSEVQVKLDTGDPNGARRLLRALLRRLDGCDGSATEAPDPNDWVVDCEEQRALRRLVERLIVEVVG